VSIVLSAVALFAVVLSVRWVSGGPADAITLLFTAPIALLAVGFGARGGAVATVLGVVLLAIWSTHAHVHFTPLGWAARVTPFLPTGVLLGAIVARLRAADAERRRLAAAAHRHREAIEINDTFIQQLTAAKWSLESGDTQAALDVVSETLELGHRLVSDLVRDAGMRSAWTGTTPPAIKE
jgi:glucose-6-phosphate-specific signal transduction histidine kinase